MVVHLMLRLLLRAVCDTRRISERAQKHRPTRDLSRPRTSAAQLIASLLLLAYTYRIIVEAYYEAWFNWI